MKNALIQTKDQSAVTELEFSTIRTTPCYCWRGEARISLACSTCRGWLNLAARVLVGGVHHAN